MPRRRAECRGPCRPKPPRRSSQPRLRNYNGAPAQEEGSVGTAHGTLLGGGALTGDGKLNLQGANGFVDLPNGIISSLSNVTLEAWLAWNGGAQWQRIFDFGSN